MLADILLGKAYPSGKLATTWTMFEDYSTAGDFGKRDDTCYREGIYVGYRYFDAFGPEPLFPFGFGLGYTDFEVGPASLKVSGAKAEVAAEITNTGNYKGKETLQVYVSCPSGRLDREVKSLAGFAKTRELAPGEKETVTVCFDIRYLAGFDTKTSSWILEKGGYVVLAGTSSADAVPAAVMTLAQDVTVRKAEGSFAAAPFEDVKNVTPSPFDARGLQETALDPAALADERPAGKTAAPGAPSLNNYTDEELAYLNVGGFNAGGLLQRESRPPCSVTGASEAL